jgi:hypothetical protein
MKYLQYCADWVRLALESCAARLDFKGQADDNFAVDAHSRLIHEAAWSEPATVKVVRS